MPVLDLQHHLPDCCSPLHHLSQLALVTCHCLLPFALMFQDMQPSIVMSAYALHQLVLVQKVARRNQEGTYQAPQHCGLQF